MNVSLKPNLSNHIVAITIVFLALTIGVVSLLLSQMVNPDWSFLQNTLPLSQKQSTEEKLELFSSNEEFSSYIAESQTSSAYLGLPALQTNGSPELMRTFDANQKLESASGGGAERVSQTNVQVKGIDEPDIVKTDGKNIYFSKESYLFNEPMLDRPFSIGIESRIIPPPQQQDLTKIISAFPPESLSKLGSVEEQGQLLYVNNKLLVITYNEIVAYNVSNPRLPVESWRIRLDDQVTYKDARLYGDELYLVTQSYVSRDTPCPLPLYTVNQTAFTVACTEIYHPTHPVSVDTTFTLSTIDTASGSITNKTSVVGASGTSVLYMSPQSIYITYSYTADMIPFLFNFYSTKAQDLLPDSLRVKLEKLVSYDISAAAKMTEFTQIWESHLASLTSDERLKVENEFQNRMQDYIKEHVRELETTGIVKLDRMNLAIKSTGSVPGHPLNQFSLDEYRENLRIATTVSDNMGWSTEGSANDVYVLDANLNKLGLVTDLGLDERIYAARFIGNTGYLVTFKETDPFYVLDLSDPKNPQMTGELKIPGFSSYLHPISERFILGVGREDSQVKLSLFDVSNPANPVEADKYLLDEYWSDVQNTHHAFLQDEKHSVFFIPAGEGGYIFSYNTADGTMNLTKAVSTIQAKRALFLNDYLYIIGEQELVVLDETNWERVNELSL
jgi:uncharacterized secreted protein with C-terminal beta-propeller domain